MRKTVTMVALLLCALRLGAEDMNPTPSPDSTMVAFTRDNDLWVKDVKKGVETRLTYDGTDLILNGYASWVYYEEILGRPSRYKAFWWSPDSRKIGFYRFDNTLVPEFPIYSAAGKYGSLNLTRYPKAGDTNPGVRVGILDLDSMQTQWVDFDYAEDQYFGIPFWSKDSRELFISRMPRRQSMLDLYAVNASSGAKRLVYHEEYPTWINWINGALSTSEGMYMVRDFETGWQQIYYLSYDGKTFKRMTSGKNWDISILRCDEKKGDVWFLAKRDSRTRASLYKVNSKGEVKALTDPAFTARGVTFDGRNFTAELSNARTPWMTVTGRADGKGPVTVVKEGASPEPDSVPVPEEISITNDGFTLYGLISYPKGFNQYMQYPVLMEVYGGPGTPCVRDVWGYCRNRWCHENGVIYIVVDPRSSGENGRAGMDQAFRQMTVIELQDYIAWARHLQSLPYVRADRIGVQGFSFGGTTTSMLVMRYPEYFHCGIAGGGVYSWDLYDSHYTERFMETPFSNPDGYALATVLNYVEDAKLPTVGADGGYVSDGTVGWLRLTHGTGDDNVHFQNTLKLADALQKAGKQFELMIYPDGMHGYRGSQHIHDSAEEADFWTRRLKN